MQFSIEAKELNVLKQYNKVSGRKDLMPILGNVLIQTLPKAIKLTVTDLEIAITTEVDVQVEEQGEALVPCDKLVKIISTANSDDILTFTLNKQNGILSIRTPKSLFKIPTQTVDEYPQIPELTFTSLTLDAYIVANMIEHVQHAISKEETRYFLTGIRMEFTKLDDGGTKLTMVATDGKRLATCSASMNADRGMLNQNIIVPMRFINIMLSTFSNDSQLNITLLGENNNQISISDGSVTMVGRLIEGDYPDWNMVVQPVLNSAVVVVHAYCMDYYNALEAVAVVADKTLGSKQSFDLSKVIIKGADRKLKDDDTQVYDDLYGLTIFADNQTGRAETELKVERHYTSEDREKQPATMDISLNIVFLRTH